MAFLPISDVEFAFEELVEKEDIPEKFVRYFEPTYIGMLTKRGTRRNAAHPIEFWNVHQRLRERRPRTNNEESEKA